MLLYRRLKVSVSHSEYSGIPGAAPIPGKDIQKFYKFAILDPFGFNYRPVFVSVRACISLTSHQNVQVYIRLIDAQTGSEQTPLQLLVEVELSNTSPHSLCMSGVQFEPAPGYEATLITRKPQDDTAIAVVDPLDVDACMAAKPLLSPGASFTAVFSVSPLIAQV